MMASVMSATFDIGGWLLDSSVGGGVAGGLAWLGL